MWKNSLNSVSDRNLNVDKRVDKWGSSVDNPLIYPQLSTGGVIHKVIHRLAAKLSTSKLLVINRVIHRFF